MTAIVVPLQAWGATRRDWDRFRAMGLTSDLLPVVSKPGMPVSPRSKLRDYLKTPSLYNANGEVVGIAKWTLHQTSDAQVERWIRQQDYGVCVQTRWARGIDIDVEDETKSNEVAALVEQELGVSLPRRRRANSGKQLLAVKVEGEIGKRVFKDADGAIEILANGQQFVAAGTHKSGARYEWIGGVIPEVSRGEFEKALDVIEMIYGTPRVSAVPSTADRPDIDKEDPVVGFLEEQGLVLGHSPRGYHILCPWADEHTSGEDGDGSTIWMPAGGKGHGAGHFKCLHAHCEGRTRNDFLPAIGFEEDVTEAFAMVAGEETGAEPEEALPKLLRDPKGAILPVINNVVAACASRKMAGAVLAYDIFRDEIMFGPGGHDGWQRFTDADYVQLRMRLEQWGFKPISREMIRDAVDAVARENLFDSARVWLEHKVPAWDGVERVERFLVTHWGAGDTPYVRGVGLYMWTALAGRVLQPGAKADMVPIFVGRQGCGKSSGVAALAPTDEVLAEVSFGDKEDDLARRIKGRIVVELGELRGLHTRELETIKAWVTRREEQWVPKFKEFATRYPRRCVLFGTTNADQFLADGTGNRRWLPVDVGVVNVEGIEADRDQLWAEARELFRQGGVRFGVEELAREAHEAHTMIDPWIDVIGRWLQAEDEPGGGKPIDRPYVTVGEVGERALNLDLRKPEARRSQMRIGEILRTEFGYERQRLRSEGARNYAYIRGTSLVPITGNESRAGK